MERGFRRRGPRRSRSSTRPPRRCSQPSRLGRQRTSIEQSRRPVAPFPGWAATPAKDRGAFLQRIAEGLQARASEIADVISHEVGMPRSLTETFQVGLPIGEFGDNAASAAAYVWQEEIGNSLVIKEPVGVVGAITPWNFPLYQVVLKVAPALAAGCTVVLKPSEVAPINAFILAEIIDEVGLPNGVFNLVTGLGPVVGEAIAAHPLVDKVSFTGSTRAGKRVMEIVRADDQARVTRNGREIGEHHLGGRRPGRSGAGRGVRLLLELGPSLLSADPDAGATFEAGGGRAAGRSRRGRLCSRRPVRRHRLGSVRSSRQSSATRSGTTSRRACKKGRPW